MQRVKSGTLWSR